jgi:hypothetical protein
MSPDKDKLLCDRYPKIFADRYGDMRTTAMCWGFECGDGWFDLIDRLCATIQGHIDHSVKQRESRLQRQAIYNEAKAGYWEKFLEYFKGFSPEFIEAEKSNIDRKVDIPEEIPQVVASQVKEKFGALCFYYAGGDDYVYGAVAMAENLSLTICEACGKPGKVKGDGWISVRCQDCR